MLERVLVHCPNDKEVYDLLMGSKKAITQRVLLDFAASRGIFYSPRNDRDQLIDVISVLPLTFSELQHFIGHREGAGRGDKTTSITLGAELTIEDMKEACKMYAQERDADEKATQRQEGVNRCVLSVEYIDLDFSKTTLLQRKFKEAEIELVVAENETMIRMPATEKGRKIVNELIEHLETVKKVKIQERTIDLSRFSSAMKTQFFTQLSSSLEGYKHYDVSHVNIEREIVTESQSLTGVDEGDDEIQVVEDETAEIKETMISAVHQAALRGQSLLYTPEYQALLNKGFYLSSIVWQSTRLDPPQDLYEFDAGFEDPKAGIGLKYNVRGMRKNRGVNSYNKTWRAITEKRERSPLLALIENAAKAVASELQSQIRAGQPVNVDQHAN
jgi:hypothetical protein